MLTVLRQRNFALLWFGGLISLAGDWMLFIALPIHVYQLTGSALATSGMLMANMLPPLLLGSVAGVFVDRWDRKRLMVITNLLLTLGLLPLLLVGGRGSLWLIYVVVLVEATIEQFFGPAKNAVLPTLVDERHLVPANALNALNNNLARLVGPAAGGLVAAWLGLRGVALLDGASFLVAAGLIALMRMPTKAPKPAATVALEVPSAWTKVWREWLQGLRLVRRERVVSILFGLSAITAIGEGILSVLLVVFVSKILGGGSREIGYLMSAQAVGGLIGGAVIGWIGARVLPARLLGWAAIIFGLGDLALFNAPLVVRSLPLELVIIALVGLPAVGLGAGFNTMFQADVADEYRGRIFGALGTTQALLMLAGMAFAGTASGWLGVIPMLNIQGSGYVLAGVLALLLLPNALRRRTQSSGELPKRNIGIQEEIAR